MVTSRWRGNKIYLEDNVWLYSSDNVRVSDDSNRVCGHCGIEPTKEGHDSCLGTLKGVLNACCGHGVGEDTYVQFESGVILRGEEAMEFMSGLFGG